MILVQNVLMETEQSAEGARLYNSLDAKGKAKLMVEVENVLEKYLSAETSDKCTITITSKVTEVGDKN